MSRSRGIGIGIPFFTLKGIPYYSNLLRFLRPRIGDRIYDIIGTYDAEETSLDVYDMNPDSIYPPDFAFQCMNKNNTSIWSETDANGNTIRDLPGYNPLDPYEWVDDEINVDIFNTYINDVYVARVFANFFGNITDLAVYDQQMNCIQSTIIHRKLKTGGWWILNRAVWNDCGVWKDASLWRDS